MGRSAAWLAAGWLSLAGGVAAAQEAPGRDAPAEAPAPAPPPVLPAPALPDEPLPPPAEREEEPEPGPDPQVLFHIQRAADPVERDVGYEVPGDLRTDTATQGRLPPSLRGVPTRPAEPDEDGLVDEPWTPPPFLVSVGAGWSRLLAEEARDYARLEQRFEARVPGFEALTLGAGVAELVGDGSFLFEAGVRVGLGFPFCEASWVRCEGQITVQPGILTGDPLGTRFDLHGAADLRFTFARLVQGSLSGGYSLVGTTSMVHAAGHVGLVF